MTANENTELQTLEKGQCLLASRVRFQHEKQPVFEITGVTETHYFLYDTVNKIGSVSVPIEDVANRFYVIQWNWRNTV